MAFYEIKHPLIQDKLTRMRKKETVDKDFRENLNEIGALMTYEAFKSLPVESIEIETPVAKTVGQTISVPIVLVPIIRAGLGMIDGIQKLIPTARIAHIGLYRDEKTLKPVEYFSKKTKNIKESYVIVVDPMLATGGSAVKAIDIVKKWGAKNIKFINLVAAPEGVAVLTAAHPDVDIYTASLDQKLDDKGYIVPGLGDAGDRIFGTK